MANIVIVIFGNIVETLIIFNYWVHSLERRFSSKTTNIIFFSVSVFIVLFSYLTLDQKILRAVTDHIILLTLMGILFRDRWPRKIMIYLLYFFCTMAAEVTSLFLSKYMFDYDLVLDGSVASYFWEIISFFLIVLFNLIALLSLRLGKLDPGSKTLQMTFLFMTIQALTAFFIIEVVYAPEMSFTRGLLIVSFTLAASLMADILIFRYSTQLTRDAAKADYLKAESDLKDRHFQEMRKRYEQFRRTEHDFLNHVRVIERTLDMDKKAEYVRNLRENLETLSRTSFCNSPALDALLFFKKDEAERKGIDLHIEICDCGDLTITDYDMCTIVSNLLDNAIEAAEQTGEKKVGLQITRKAGRLLIKVENSSNPMDPELKTSKEDKSRHGIGLESIRETARKYDGDTLLEYKDGIFESVVNVEE